MSVPKIFRKCMGSIYTHAKTLATLKFFMKLPWCVQYDSVIKWTFCYICCDEYGTLDIILTLESIFLNYCWKIAIFQKKFKLNLCQTFGHECNLASQRQSFLPINHVLMNVKLIRYRTNTVIITPYLLLYALVVSCQDTSL